MLNTAMRIEWAAGMQASVFANINKKPSAPAFKPSDFMVNGTDEAETDDLTPMERDLIKWGMSR